MPKKSYNKSKKYNKTLNKKNIFSKKGAKSQAKQIYALDKKINRVYREVAPEIKTFNKNLVNINTLYNGDNIQEYHNVAGVYHNMLNVEDEKHYEMKGDMMRIRNLTLYGSFQFNRGMVNIERDNVDLGKTYNDTPYVAYVRIIIARIKKGSAYRLPYTITSEILQNPSQDGSIKDLSLINGPLIENIGSTISIIKQKIIKINYSNPCKLFKIKLGSSIIQKNDYQDNDKFMSNEVLVYYQYVCPNILQVANSTTQQIYKVGPVTHFQLNYKVAYTDDD